jgi:branched-chain amino acid transport system substrate-binding protein
VLAITTPDYAALPAAQAAVSALRKRNIEPDGYTLPAYASVELVNAAQKQMDSGSLNDSIAKIRTQTAIGPLGFGADHELINNPYQLMEWHDGAFQAATEH